MFGGGFRGFDGFGGFSNEDGQDQSNNQKGQVDTNKYYQLLGVDKKATTQQIRKAFRKKALKQHPDKGGDPQKFKQITAAYQVLSNPQKRQLYDDYGEQGVKNGGPPGGSGMGGLFDLFGGGRQKSKGPKKGKVRLIQTQVTLQEIYSGIMKNIKITRTRICQPCDGKGGKNVVKCTKCKGQGIVNKLVQLGPGMFSQSQAHCPDCKGQGQTMKQQDKCKICKGQKVVKVDKTLQVAVQPGCPNEHDYIFTGQSDQYPGIMAGDVYVRIKIKKHQIFERRGADLIYVKKITLLQALTGVTIQINHLDGKKKVIATSPGEILKNLDIKTAKRLGLPFYKDPMSYGHLYIQFFVNFPKKNSISGANIEKIAKVLDGKVIKSQGYSKSKNFKILQQFKQSDLNEHPGGQEQEQHHNGGSGGAQRVQCQQQ